jgi:hypothetical protein
MSDLTVPESLEQQRRRARTSPAVLDFLQTGGWQLADGAGKGGLTTHRGVLHPDEWEWLDWRRAAAMVEAELGFTITEVRSVYRQGRLSDEQRELRARVDARLLSISQAGGNMAMLGRVLGFSVPADRSCRVIGNALSRALAVPS